MTLPGEIELGRLDPIDRWCRRFVLFIGLPLLLFLLFGCASEPFWHMDIQGYKPPVSIHRFETAQQLSTACNMERKANAACSIRLPTVCIVYLGPEANACAESHEKNGHCRGYNHFLTYGLVQDCAYEGKT